MNTPTPPKPLSRPKLAMWMWLRGLTPRDAEDATEVSREVFRKAILPFDNPAFREPSEKIKLKIRTWTGGDIGLCDWAPVMEPAE